MTELPPSKRLLLPDSQSQPTAERWTIPRSVWLVLMSWGLAVAGIALLLSWWIWRNERAADAEREAIRSQQDQAMCALTGILLGGPEPVAGPAGDRGREVQRAVNTYRATLGC